MRSSAQFVPLWAYAALLSGMLLVGTYVGLSKPLTAALPVFLLAGLRFAIAAVIMLPWTLGPRLPIQSWIYLGVQSFFGNFLFSICMLYGVAFSNATSAGVIMSTLPAAVAVFSRLYLKEQLQARTWWAVVISVVGVLILQWAQQSSAEPVTNPAVGPRPVLGNLLLLAAVACEAIYVLMAKRLSQTLSPMRNSALLNLLGLLFMAPLALSQGIDFDFAKLQSSTWLLLLFYAFAASVGSTWLWLTGLQWVPASRAGVFTIGLPLAAAAVGIFVLGERVGPLHVLALACCVLAIILAARADSQDNR